MLQTNNFDNLPNLKLFKIFILINPIVILYTHQIMRSSNTPSLQNLKEFSNKLIKIDLNNMSNCNDLW